MDERAGLLEKAGRTGDAEKAYGEARAVAERLHDVHCLGAIQTQLGLLHDYAGNYGQAASEFAKAIDLFQSLKEEKAEAVLWTLLASVHLTIDSQVSAAEAIARAKELAKTSRFAMAGSIAGFLDAALQWRQGQRADVRGAFLAMLADREVRNAFELPRRAAFALRILRRAARPQRPDRRRVR